MFPGVGGDPFDEPPPKAREVSIESKTRGTWRLADRAGRVRIRRVMEISAFFPQFISADGCAKPREK